MSKDGEWTCSKDILIFLGEEITPMTALCIIIIDSLTMRESVPEYLLFDKKAKTAFSILEKDFNYKLIETVAKPNYVRHTYRNRWRRRNIVIENQTFPVDYGFGFVIYNLWTKEHFIF